MAGASLTQLFMLPRCIKLGFWATAGLIIISCGAPLGPVPFAWERKTVIPDEYSTLRLEAIGPKGLYSIVTTQTGYGKLVTFDGSRFDVDYQTASPDDLLTSVAFSGENGFLGLAHRTYPEGYDAALLFFRSGRWRPVLVAPEYNSFTILAVYGEGACLLLCGRENGAEVDVVIYSEGHLNIKGTLAGNFAGYSPGNGFLYTYNRFEPESRDIFVSSDAGATWHRETVKLPPPYVLKRIVSAATSPDALYLVGRVEVAGLEYYSIIKRAGEPGDGIYELSYIGWQGPGVGQVDRCAFRDTATGIAVGLGTSMYYEAGRWFRETVEPLQTFDDLLTDPRRGYWAISGREIIWHP